MKTRITSFSSAVIAASIIFLTVTMSNSLEAKPIAGAVVNTAGNIRTERNFLSPLGEMAVPGVYDLSFRVYRNGVLEAVSSLPVLSEEMILVAHVEDTNGNPAQGGTVNFEYCSYKGRPPNDIDRADEAPKEACDAGIATWDRLGRVSIGTCPGLPGSGCLVFGIVQNPRDVGFRFKYSGRRGGVDSGMSGAANFSWTSPL